MKKLFLASVIILAGCLSIETTKTLDERRAAVEDAKVRLAQITNVDAPDYSEARAALQTAEAELDVAKAKANQERLAKGLAAVELGASIVSPFAATNPLIGAAISALVAGVTAVMKR